VWRNLFYRCGAATQDDGFTYDKRDNAEYDDDPGFVDAEADDYRLRPETPALATGFVPLPIERMGLYADDLRPTWPVDAVVSPMPDWRQRG
jgi:hypothetical protein